MIHRPTILDLTQLSGTYEHLAAGHMFNRSWGTFFSILPMKEIAGTTEKILQTDSTQGAQFHEFGAGVPVTDASYNVKEESTFPLSAFSRLDRGQVANDPRPLEEQREEEDLYQLEGMGKKASYQAFYGLHGNNDDGFTGLFYRLPQGASTTLPVGETEKLSIYAIKWGAKKFSGIYTPTRNHVIDIIDHGLVLENNSDTTRSVYMTEFESVLGLAQYSEKAIGRLSGITEGALPTARHFTSLFDAMEEAPDILVMNWYTYGLLLSAQDSKLIFPLSEESDGLHLGFGSILGVPIVVDSALVSDESAVNEG